MAANARPEWLPLASSAAANDHLRSTPVTTGRNIFSMLFPNRHQTVPAIVFGLAGAGKRTLLAQIAGTDPQDGESEGDFSPIALDFAVKGAKFRSVVISSPGSKEEGCFGHLRDVIDALGTQPIEPRPALIYVCDANRFQNFNDEGNSVPSEDTKLFRDFLMAIRTSPALAHAALLVFSNKIDLPEAANAALVTDRLGLHNIRHRHWYIQSCHAKDPGQGVREGFYWLEQTLQSKYDAKEREGDVLADFEWPDDTGGGMTKSAAKR
jgi:ADP-ribosylation factor family